jgi:hypothetical protein
MIAIVATAEKGGDFAGATRSCSAQVCAKDGLRTVRLDRAALEEDDVLHRYLDCITCPLWRATLGTAWPASRCPCPPSGA